MKKQSKSAFIRAQTAGLPASEVVKRASTAGLEITTQLVHVIRSVARRKLARGLPAMAPMSTLSAGRPAIDSSSSQFLELVADIGLRRAEMLLSAVKARMTSTNVT